ncbi:32198_t:CDS:2, partial [Gigaspora margarita]
MTGFMDKIVNKAFENVLSEINKKSSEKALNEVEDNNGNNIEKDAKEIIDCAEDGERIRIKINQHLDWVKNKQKRKLSIAKNIGHEYVYNLEETPANPSKLQENVIALHYSQHHNREVLKILQIDCTFSKISENKAEASTKKHGRKKLYVSQISFRSEVAIHIIEQIDHAIRVDESGKRISGRVQPDEPVRRGAIHTSSSASSSSGS